MPSIPHDYHMHSRHSCDCQAPMAQMCQAAVERGIAEIGFTEHFDLHPGDECRGYFKLEPWAAELEAVRAEFDGRLTVRAGIELGEPHIYPAQARAILARYPFDYCLGSLHWVGDQSVFDNNYFKSNPADVTFPAFFAELERLTAQGGFDILSHFDVPARHATAIYGGYDPKRYEDQIRPVLRNCVANGLALDLNTSILRQRGNHIMTPGPDILRWYVELGGERVTLGSDAHQPSQVGSYLPEAMDIARAAGLKYLTHFSKRQARLELMP
ncbi:MAG: histidinol-phosphatase HisJ family protein [Anaerolineales bacterium]